MPTLSRRLRLVSLVPLLAAFACGRPAATPAAAPPAAQPATAVADVFSFARPREIAVRHLALDLAVDFERRTLGGTATLELVHHAPATQLVLDTQGLTIEGVTRDGGKATTFTLAEARPHLGQALAIAVEPDTRTVEVRYHTAPAAGALQWLEPAQTAGGVHPYLFTQSQPILARSWVPCQDTPQVRMTYEAVVKVPQGLMAVMSAANATTTSADGVYRFRMAQPIPSYLLALAVGDIAFAPLGERAGVFAEPSVLAGAAAELAPVEGMMTAAEALYGPYRWDRYDVLIMPPSFPIGGMENPRLTFATPTILAGDGSLLALVAHELAHSWSGNLVTNATWNDLWLNEGFTVYFERRIVEATEGRDSAEMQAQLGYQDLEATVAELGATSPLTELHTDLTADADPGDSFSDVAYEKGYFFLRLVEESVGRDRFDAFLAEHFETWAFRSLDTPTFVASLEAKLLAADPALAAKIAVASWIDGPGIPANCPRPQTSAFAKVDTELAALEAGKPARELVTAGWKTQQWMHFLRHLPAGLEPGRLAELDAAFGFTASGNSEIAAAWFEQVVPLRYQAADQAFEAFLARVGRQKFLKPLYGALLESGQADRARAIYLRARPTYHPVTVATLDKLLEWDQSATTTLPSTPPASSAS